MDNAASSTAWIHEVVDHRVGGLAVSYIRIVVGPKPSAWREEETWSYTDYSFAARAVRVRDVRDWFETCDPQGWSEVVRQDGGLRLVEDVDKNISHNPSLVAHDPLRYPYPTIKFAVTLDVDSALRQIPSEYFVGDGCPSFATSASAFNAFFNDDFRGSGMSASQLGVMEVSFVDTRGSLDSVVV